MECIAGDFNCISCSSGLKGLPCQVILFFVFSAALLLAISCILLFVTILVIDLRLTRIFISVNQCRVVHCFIISSSIPSFPDTVVVLSSYCNCATFVFQRAVKYLRFYFYTTHRLFGLPLSLNVNLAIFRQALSISLIAPALRFFNACYHSPIFFAMPFFLF